MPPQPSASRPETEEGTPSRDPNPSSKSNLNFTFANAPAQVLPRTPSAASPNAVRATRSSGAPRSSPKDAPQLSRQTPCAAPSGAREAPHARAPARGRAVQPPARCARSAARSRPRARQTAQPHARNQNELMSLGRQDHDLRLRAHTREPAEPGACCFNRMGGSLQPIAQLTGQRSPPGAITPPAPPTPNQQQEANDPTPAPTTACAAHARLAIRDHRA